MAPRADAVGRIRRSLGGGVSDRIVFLHLPKAGGQSVDAAIRSTLGYGVRMRPNRAPHLDAVASRRAAELTGEPLDLLREKLLLYHMANPRTRYISGHFAYSEIAAREYAQEWRMITVLREPVARWFSFYFFNRHKDSSHFSTELDVESYAGSQLGRELGCDLVRRFAPGTTYEGAATDEAVNRATANIRSLALVGLLEQLEQFTSGFDRTFGARLKIGRRNPSPVPMSAQREAISDEMRRAVEKICEPDTRVYQAVRDWHDSRVQIPAA